MQQVFTSCFLDAPLWIYFRWDYVNCKDCVTVLLPTYLQLSSSLRDARSTSSAASSSTHKHAWPSSFLNNHLSLHQSCPPPWGFVNICHRQCKVQKKVKSDTFFCGSADCVLVQNQTLREHLVQFIKAFISWDYTTAAAWSAFTVLTPFCQACKPLLQPLHGTPQQWSVEKHQSFSPWSSGLAGAVMHCTTEMLNLQEGD